MYVKPGQGHLRLRPARRIFFVDDLKPGNGNLKLEEANL
jgi:hypothetical protein